MGDTYGAWEVVLDDNSHHLIVAKAYAAAHSKAVYMFGSAIQRINLIGTNNSAKQRRFRSVEVAEE